MKKEPVFLLFQKMQGNHSLYYKSLLESPCLQTWDERHYFFF